MEWGFCDQLCMNTDGGYQCSCANGYILKERNHCQATNASDLVIYFAHERAIHVMNSRGEDLRIIANTTGASGLDFHYAKNWLFYSDVKTKRVCV